MEVNHALTGDQRDQDAFQEYMKNWPFAAADKQELIALATGYEGTELAGNFRLRAALAERDGLARAMKLRHLADGTDDAAIIANYELGRLGMMLADDPAWEVMDLASAETYFRIVISAPENPYRPSAERYLLRLGGGDGG